MQTNNISFGAAVQVKFPNNYKTNCMQEPFDAMTFAIVTKKLIDKKGTKPFPVPDNKFAYVIANGIEKQKLEDSRAGLLDFSKLSSEQFGVKEAVRIIRENIMATIQKSGFFRSIRLKSHLKKLKKMEKMEYSELIKLKKNKLEQSVAQKAREASNKWLKIYEEKKAHYSKEINSILNSKDTIKVTYKV